MPFIKKGRRTAACRDTNFAMQVFSAETGRFRYLPATATTE